MKNIICIISVFVSLMLSSCSGDMFDNIKEYGTDEKVFVGKFDGAVATVGLNRVEIDLVAAGRIPSDQIKIGKAVRTVVEYDDKKITYEPVPSWINLENLTEPKLYRIKVFNEDELGNRSLPVEVAIIPFTSPDLANIVAPAPEKVLAPQTATFNWPNGLANAFYQFYELECSYTALDGPHTIKTTSTRFGISNLAEGSAGSAKLRWKILPIHNGSAILDTVYLESTVPYQLPSIAEYLALREDRKVKYPFLDGYTAKIDWGTPTLDLVLTELEYETNAGTFATVRVKDSENSVQCPNAKPNVLYRTRSAFVAPGSTDTLYRAWVPSKYPFLTFPIGKYMVDPLSWRGNKEGNPSSPIPQSEYSINHIVTIEAVEEAQYRITDLFGGFYEPGRAGYGSAYISWGIFSFDGTTISLVDALTDPWGTGFYRLSGSFDESTQTLSLDIPWGSADPTDYTFHLILHKQ